MPIKGENPQMRISTATDKSCCLPMDTRKYFRSFQVANSSKNIGRDLAASVTPIDRAMKKITTLKVIGIFAAKRRPAQFLPPEK
jgi:hypothetical protein